MKNRHAVISLATLALSCLMLAAADVIPVGKMKPVTLSQAIDILDTSNHSLAELGCTAGYLTKEFLHKRVKDSYDAGIRKLYFRGTGGVTYFPGSKLRRMYTGVGPGHMNAARTFANYDILAEYIKAAHELGMELYYWEPIFDAHGLAHYPKGTEGYEKYGEWPLSDTSIPLELNWEHRFAKRPPQNLARPIRKITVKLYNTPELTKDNLELLTAPHDGDFTAYKKPYTVAVEPVQGQGVHCANLVVDGLDITDPVVKFIFKGDDIKVGVFCDNFPEATTAEYDDGTPVGLFTTTEAMAYGDIVPSKNRRGFGGFSLLCGGKTASGPITFIVHFDQPEPYARGLPEYAYQQNRDRLRNIAAELYELYPDLDGIAFSIRTHTLPAGGSAQAVGTPLAYGYSDPVVNEFIRRYGVNPREDPFDENLYLKVHGEFFTQMLGEVAEVVHAHGGKLECMAPIIGASKIAHGSMYPWWARYNIDNFFDIRTWAQKGYVDTVIMLGTEHHQTVWDQKWKGAVQRFADHLKGTKTRLCLHMLNGRKPEPIRGLIEQVLKEEPEIDEIEIYEEWEMQAWHLYPAYSEGVKASGRRIVGVDVPMPSPAGADRGKALGR